MAHCSIAGFYKLAVREYKNILIFSLVGSETRKNQGAMAVFHCFDPIPQAVCQPCVSLLMADCVRHNRSFPPLWAQISVFS
jgi:hypothetical protein